MTPSTVIAVKTISLLIAPPRCSSVAFGISSDGSEAWNSSPAQAGHARMFSIVSGLGRDHPLASLDEA
jgi:hypothetical protein